MATVLFDGVAYGMVLFILACGLSVTLGLMNLINLAHGAFAMAGGYITVLLMQRLVMKPLKIDACSPGNANAPHAPARANLPLLPSGPGGVQSGSAT